MKLTIDEIKHIAGLARLELSDKELKKYGSQLSDVLDWIDQLKEVDTKGVEPTAQVTGLENVLRQAVVKAWDDQERTAALDEAPELEDGQVKVKRILE